MFSKLFCVFYVVAFLVPGCGPRRIANPREVAGEYVFRSKTGEAEVLILHEDFSYRQEFYRNVEAYLEFGVPAYTNGAAWSYDRSTLTMSNFMHLFEFPNPEKWLDPPERSQSTPGFWYRPSSKREAAIELSEAFDYVLIRVKNRKEMK
jgi:hypothetical protein